MAQCGASCVLQNGTCCSKRADSKPTTRKPRADVESANVCIGRDFSFEIVATSPILQRCRTSFFESDSPEQSAPRPHIFASSSILCGNWPSASCTGMSCNTQPKMYLPARSIPAFSTCEGVVCAACARQLYCGDGACWQRKRKFTRVVSSRQVTLPKVGMATAACRARGYSFIRVSTRESVTRQASQHP